MFDRCAGSWAPRAVDGRCTSRTIRVLMTLGMLSAAATAVELRAQPTPAVGRMAKPAWVVDDVPDTVWILMESAVASADEAKMKALLREAEDRAREAVSGHEKSVGRRFALAAVLGMRADREGGRTKVRAGAALYDELTVVLELDPENARAHYMMGRLHAGVRRMGGVSRWIATNLLGGSALEAASWEEAERHLAFAAEHAPKVPDHHLQLARLYLDTGRPELAFPELDRVLAMQPRSPMEWEAWEEALGVREALVADTGGGASL